MLDLHVRHHEPGQTSKDRKVPVAEEPASTEALKAAIAARARAQRQSRAAPEPYHAPKLPIDRSYSTILVPLTNGDSETIVAHARVYAPWKEFLAVMDWRLLNGQAVTDFGGEVIEMSCLMRHMAQAKYPPCEH